MRKAALHNLGCKVNAYETEAMQQMLKEAGYEIVDFADCADVYVINTCSVTNMADRKSRQMIHRAKKKNKDAVLVATGCYVQTAGEQLKEDLSIDILLGNNKKSELVDALEEYYHKHEKVDHRIDINEGKQPYEELWMTDTSEHTRAFLKVQDGCNQFCSYCIIPYARGRIRSRKLEHVKAEVEALAASGYKEIVLTGIHLSSYGKDFDEDITLLTLIRTLHEVEGIERIRLGSLEPGIITEEFAQALASLEKVCPHFHLSLQSGCDATLKRMNRKYTTEEYAKKCEILRRVYEHPAITTDVIVGFPGETEEEFETTKAFLAQIGFYEMHIFQYSKRQGTRAAVMENQVPEELKKDRSAKLIQLAEQMSKEFREYYVGKVQDVLIEEVHAINHKNYYVGYSKEYVKYALEEKCAEQNVQERLENRIIQGKVLGELAGGGHDGCYVMVEF